MKTKTINLYTFEEASKDLQEKILEKYSDINTDYNWWEFVCIDAEDIGIKLEVFDLDRKNCNGKLISSASESIDKILENHGEESETYKTALLFKRRYDAYILEDEDLTEFEESYLKVICKNYLQILQKEYEYLTSEETIKETLIANEYYFNENGEIDN